MPKKISVIGDKGVDIAHELARSASVGEDLSGADVVVLAGEADLDTVRTRAPAAVAESILFERDGEHEVIAMSDGRFAATRARLGRGGIRALL